MSYGVFQEGGDLFGVGLGADKVHHGRDIETTHLSKIPGPEFGVGGFQRSMFRTEVSTVISQPHVIFAFTKKECQGRFVVDTVRARRLHQPRQHQYRKLSYAFQRLNDGGRHVSTLSHEEGQGYVVS